MSSRTNNARTGALGASPRIFHGWWIVATAFIALAVNVGLLFEQQHHSQANRRLRRSVVSGARTRP